MRMEGGLGAEPLRKVFESRTLFSAINAANAHFYTRIAVEKHEKVATVENKKQLQAVNIISKASGMLELNAHAF